MEASFTVLAMKAAEGEYPEEQLAEKGALLEASRERCAAAYQRAFPNAARRARRPTVIARMHPKRETRRTRDTLISGLRTSRAVRGPVTRGPQAVRSGRVASVA